MLFIIDRIYPVIICSNYDYSAINNAVIMQNVLSNKPILYAVQYRDEKFYYNIIMSFKNFWMF